MVWGRVLTVLDSPVNREEAKWSSTPKCRPPRAAGSRCACHLSGLLKPSVFFRLPRRLTKQRLQATPTPIVMLLQSPSESGGCSAAARSSAGGKRPEAALVFFSSDLFWATGIDVSRREVHPFDGSCVYRHRQRHLLQVDAEG